MRIRAARHGAVEKRAEVVTLRAHATALLGLAERLVRVSSLLACEPARLDLAQRRELLRADGGRLCGELLRLRAVRLRLERVLVNERGRGGVLSGRRTLTEKAVGDGSGRS